MALSAHHATILLDNTDPSLIYGSGWTSVDETADIGGETTWASNSNNTFVACSFQGTSISFTGNTERTWSNLTAILDSGTPTNSSVLEGTPGEFYTAWYNSPILPDGNHTVNLTGLTGVALDYVTIEAGLNTPLVGTTLIVDDNDTAVVYTGNWVQSPEAYSLYGQHDSTSIMPHLNTTHYSNTAGDTASIAFTGTSVSVYGVISWSLVGNISVSFLLDGTWKSAYNLISNGADPMGKYNDRTGFQFFTTQFAAGDHVLEVNVTENNGNQFFILDYFLYQPSFSTLATMPNVTVPPPSPTLPPSPTISPPSHQAKSSPTTGVLVGSIVGGVVGGFLLIIVLGVFFYKRRSHKIIDAEIDAKPSIGDVHPFQTEPFIPTLAQGDEVSNVAATLQSASARQSQKLSAAASNLEVNSLAAENEALRRRLLELESHPQDAGRSSTNLNPESGQSTLTPNNGIDRVVQAQRQMEEKVRVQQELAQPPPSYE